VIAVILSDCAGDLAILEKAASIAQRDRDRLTVLIAPRLSPWLAGCALMGGIPLPTWIEVDDENAQAIERCRAMTLSVVPQDVSVTTRAIPNGQPRAVARIIEQISPDLLLSDGTGFDRRFWRRSVLANGPDSPPHVRVSTIG
jgi:hypothetical protein